jgi:hypothetical protein
MVKNNTFPINNLSGIFFFSLIITKPSWKTVNVSLVGGTLKYIFLTGKNIREQPQNSFANSA